jgi:predicted ATPase
MIHLRSVRVRNPEALPKGFPFDLPIVRTLDELELTAPVVFLVGENGSGKSTLLEAIAASANLPTIGSVDIERDETLTAAQALGRQLVLSWATRSHRGFYMRSEDFFGFGLTTTRTIAELREIAETFPPDSHAYGSVMAQSRALETKYGDLNARSHGEGFFQLFAERFTPGGVYLLDEPEVALSPQRQIALLLLMKEVVAREAQFIIATHSPMLMAYPGAQILHLTEAGIREQPWEDVEHVQLSRDFLTDPDRFLRHL